MREVLAEVVEVRPNRPLFVRQLEIGHRPPTVQIVAVHGTCATEAQYQLLWEAMEAQWRTDGSATTSSPDGHDSKDDSAFIRKGGLAIVAYDSFGLAQSATSSSSSSKIRHEDYANEELQEDLLAVVEQFANADLPLVMMGHSYGTTHIFATLRRIQQQHPSRVVAGLVLIGTAVASEHLPIANGGHPIMKLPVFVLDCLQRFLTDSFLQLAIHPNNSWLSDQLRRASNSNDMRVAQAYHTQMVWTPTTSWPALSLPPALIVHGADDRLIPINCAQHLHNAMSSSSSSSSSELLVVDAASHLVHMEQAPQVATAVLSFLAKIMTSSSR
jgi:pimeloyl-ACP methyl ester carboxylesterase